MHSSAFRLMRFSTFGSANLEKITLADIVAAGLASAKQLVKILGNGQLTSKVDVEANAFSKSAEAAIKAAGGNATKL